MFLIGAAGYPAMELLYRGRTHWSMALAGGTAAVLIDKVSRWHGRLLSKSILCGLGITGIEYLCGCRWNKDYQVWDYRKVPLNWKGQVCVPYMLLWTLISSGMLTILGISNADKPDE